MTTFIVKKSKDQSHKVNVSYSLRGKFNAVKFLTIEQPCELQTWSRGEYINPLMATLQPQSNGSYYTAIRLLYMYMAVDGWAVTFGTARRELGGAAALPGPSSLYQM